MSPRLFPSLAALALLPSLTRAQARANLRPIIGVVANGPNDTSLHDGAGRGGPPLRPHGGQCTARGT